MTETIVSNLKHTVHFSRKVNLGNYESTDADMFLQFDTPEGASFEDIIAKAQEAFVACKGTVLSELGISYTLNEEGILVEEVGSAPRTTAAAPAAAPKQTLQSTPDATTQLREAFGGGTVSEDTTVRAVNFGGHDSSIDPLTITSKAEQKKWLEAELKLNPGAFFDNRATKTGKQPDYRHKASKLGVWAA